MLDELRNTYLNEFTPTVISSLSSDWKILPYLYFNSKNKRLKSKNLPMLLKEKNKQPGYNKKLFASKKNQYN